MPQPFLRPSDLLGPAFNVIERALARQDVPIEMRDVPAAAAKVVETIQQDATVAVVPVKPAVASKINWLQIAGIGASVAAYFGLDLSAADLAAVIGGIQAVVAVVTVVMRTWFTKSVTTESAAKA